MPIPIAKAMAPETVASGIPTATPPKITPIANPSGILCKVMASANKVVFLQGVFIPSLSLKFMCI